MAPGTCGEVALWSHDGAFRRPADASHPGEMRPLAPRSAIFDGDDASARTSKRHPSRRWRSCMRGRTRRAPKKRHKASSWRFRYANERHLRARETVLKYRPAFLGREKRHSEPRRRLLQKGEPPARLGTVPLADARRHFGAEVELIRTPHGARVFGRFVSAPELDAALASIADAPLKNGSFLDRGAALAASVLREAGRSAARSLGAVRGSNRAQVEREGEPLSTDGSNRSRSRPPFADGASLAFPEVAAVNAAANAAAESKKEDAKRSVSSRKRTGNGLIAQSVELRTFNP
jgi:hypothetical protein